MSFFEELRRRNVFRAGIAYIVVAWLILQVADVILNNIEAPDWIFQVILLLLALGFPLVLIFAWAFELTPEGIKRDSEVDRSQPPVYDTGRTLDFVIIGLLAIALGYFAFDKFVVSPQREAALVKAATQAVIDEATAELGVAEDPHQSIAVLPFKNRTNDPNQEYLSDGLSEELLNLLAKIRALRVIARTSSFAYKDVPGVTIADISRDLNVNHVLEGSVQTSGAQLRIRAQLIRASDESQLWSDSYEYLAPNDIFAIQDEIAGAVVEQLQIILFGDPPKSHAINPNAYTLYLQARELSRQSTKEGQERAIERYKQALEIEPEYAAAKVGLSENYIFLADRSLLGSVIQDINEGYRLARDAANEALSIDPDNALAHASLGRIAMVHDKDLRGAALNFERALELDPTNPQIIRRAAILSMNLHRLVEAIELLEYGIARDPISSDLHSNLALAYFGARRPDEAADSYRTALILSPNAIGVHSFIGQALLMSNQPEEALAEMLNEKSEPWRLIGLAMAYHALGQAAESDAKLAELIEKYGDEWPYNISYVLAYRGDVESTFDWLKKAQEYNDPGLSEVSTAPEFDTVRNDPRWSGFLQDIGQAPDQLAQIKFKVTLPK